MLFDERTQSSFEIQESVVYWSCKRFHGILGSDENVEDVDCEYEL